MSILCSKSDGRYAFREAKFLKAFLLIDGQCLARTSKGRCERKLSNKCKEIDGELQHFQIAGFPSAESASKLQEIAGKCICKGHPTITIGLGQDTKVVEQCDYIYSEWNRRLWIAYLEVNHVSWIHVNDSPPDLSLGTVWVSELQRLKSIPRSNAGPILQEDKPAQPTRKTTFPDLANPLPPKRASTLPVLRDLSLRRALKKANPFSRAHNPARPILGRRDGNERIPTVRAEKASMDQQRLLKQVGQIVDKSPNPWGTNIVAQARYQIATPRTTRPWRHGVGSRPEELHNEHDTSPTLSPSSSAPSPMFSEDDSNLDQTPNTSYSVEVDTTDKHLSNNQMRIPGSFPTDTSPRITVPDQGMPVSVLGSDSTVFNGPRGPGTFSTSRWMVLSRENAHPARGKSGSGSKKPPFKDVFDPLDSPTKTKHVVREDPSRSRGDDRQMRASRENSDFEIYRRKKDEKQYKALTRVLDRLGKPFHGERAKAGYIYIFRRYDEPDFVKIGRSTNAFGKRAETISEKCGYEASLIEQWHMDVAVSLIESCVHDHLDEDRHWDVRCVRIHRESKGTAAGNGKKLCDAKHKEWFKTSENTAKDVVAFWYEFVQARPFENGRLNSFWWNEVVGMRDKMASWQRDGYSAFGRWGKEMRAALERWDQVSKGSPVADLQLQLRVRSDGRNSTVGMVDDTGRETSMLTTPLLSRRGDE